MPSCIVDVGLAPLFRRDRRFEVESVLGGCRRAFASENSRVLTRRDTPAGEAPRNSSAPKVKMMGHLVGLLLLVASSAATLSADSNPEYVKQCSRSDPKLKTCLINALHHLRPYLSVGIPEIELPSVEPFRMDELTLSLTGGTNGYKVQLRELYVRGASNFTVEDIKLGSPFEAIIRMPALILDAHYSSSGVLIILPASGNGTFHARFDDLKALVKGTVSTKQRDGKTYLNVENLDVDLDVKTVQMRVRKFFNNNRILTEAINLFLRENGQEVLKVMEPQLNRKLSVLFAGIVNQLLRHVPVEVFLLP